MLATPLHTDPSLLRQLHQAAQHKMTPAEREEQRVSWCLGMLPMSSPLSKSDVREILKRQKG